MHSQYPYWSEVLMRCANSEVLDRSGCSVAMTTMPMHAPTTSATPDKSREPALQLDVADEDSTPGPGLVPVLLVTWLPDGLEFWRIIHRRSCKSEARLRR